MLLTGVTSWHVGSYNEEKARCSGGDCPKSRRGCYREVVTSLRKGCNLWLRVYYRTNDFKANLKISSLSLFVAALKLRVLQFNEATVRSLSSDAVIVARYAPVWTPLE